MLPRWMAILLSAVMLKVAFEVVVSSTGRKDALECPEFSRCLGGSKTNSTLAMTILVL